MTDDKIKSLITKYGLLSWEGESAQPRDFSVGEGWYDILDKAFFDLITLGWDRRVRQLKEKFGTISLYIGPASDEIYRRIRDLEDESATVCETCGAPGTLGGVWWIKSACPEHTKQVELEDGSE